MSELKWISWSKSDHYVWIMSILGCTMTSYALKRSISGYLEQKLEGRKTLMDYAHQYLLNALIWTAGVYNVGRIAHLSLDVVRHQLVVGLIHKTLFDMASNEMMFAFLVDFNLQFALAMDWEPITKMASNERQVANWTRWLLRGVALGLSILMTWLGDRGIFYNQWTRDVSRGITIFVIIKGIMSAVATLNVLITRIALKIRFKNRKMAANQIISSWACFITTIFHLPFLFFRNFFRDDSSASATGLLDFHVNGIVIIFLSLCILFHSDLRAYVVERIQDLFMIALEQSIRFNEMILILTNPLDYIQYFKK